MRPKECLSKALLHEPPGLHRAPTPAGTGRPSCSRARGARSFTQALGIKARVLLRGL